MRGIEDSFREARGAPSAEAGEQRVSWSLCLAIAANVAGEMAWSGDDTRIQAERGPRPVQADILVVVLWTPVTSPPPRSPGVGRWRPGRSWRNPGLHDDHVRPAARALQWGPRLELSDQALRLKAEEPLQHGNQAFAVGMEKPVVAGASESLGQDMLEHQGEEACPWQGAVLEALALGIAVAEGHLPVLAGDDVFLLDDAAIEIAPQIDQCLLATANVLAVDDPGAR